MLLSFLFLSYGLSKLAMEDVELHIDAAERLAMGPESGNNEKTGYFPTAEAPVGLITGKFGYDDMFKDEVDCDGAIEWLKTVSEYHSDFVQCLTTFPDYVLVR